MTKKGERMTKKATTKRATSKRAIRQAFALLLWVVFVGLNMGFDGPIKGVGLTAAYADVVVREFANDEQESRYQTLINDFRCPTCQNQNLAGSDAPIAQDLKQKTYEMIRDGRTDGEIRAFMFERYGDFISYKPPVRPSTWILWFFPPVLLLGIVLAWLARSRKTSPAPSNITLLSDDEAKRLQALLNAHKPTTPQEAPKEQQ